MMIFSRPLARGMILAVHPRLERNEILIGTCDRAGFHSEVGKLFDGKVEVK
jgi:hypothetical protein